MNFCCWFFAFTVAVNAKLTISYYELIGVKPTCTEFELKKRYRALAKEYHPDRIVGNARRKEEAAEVFVVIAKGYEVLSDPELRTKYDELLTYGIYEYKEDEYDEWNARRHGWRSDAEVNFNEGLVLYTMLLGLFGCGGGAFYFAHKEKTKKEKKKAAAQDKFMAQLDSKVTKNEPLPAKKPKVLSASQLAQRKANYQRSLKIYHKMLKQALRTQLTTDHGLWFCPTLTSDEISALCTKLPMDDLTVFTIRLCDELDVSLPMEPTVPEGCDIDADIYIDPDVSAKLEVAGARGIMKTLKVMANEFLSLEKEAKEVPQEEAAEEAKEVQEGAATKKM